MVSRNALKLYKGVLGLLLTIPTTTVSYKKIRVLLILILPLSSFLVQFLNTLLCQLVYTFFALYAIMSLNHNHNLFETQFETYICENVKRFSAYTKRKSRIEKVVGRLELDNSS